MAKRGRESDSNGTTPTTTAPITTSYNTIFIDTSLDTHLAVSVSDSDTVTILKEKIVSEHAQCFPEIGKIKIHALKVKRKGYFYHLPDYMHVKSVFVGATKSWFLYVDVSILKVHNGTEQLVNLDLSYQKALVCIEHFSQGHNQQDYIPDDPLKTPSAINESANAKFGAGFEGEVSKDIAMEVGRNADALCNDFSSTSGRSPLRVQNSDEISAKNRISEITPGYKDDNKNVGCYSAIGEANPAKKYKSERGAVVACSASKDNNGSMHASNKNASHFEALTTVKSSKGNKEDKKTKRKRIKDSIRHCDQDAASVLSPAHDVGVKRSFEQNTYAAVGSDDNVQHGVLSEPSELSQNQMQHDHYQDKGKESTLPEVLKDLHEPHDVNTDSKIDVLEKAGESKKGGASSKKRNKTNVEYFPAPAIPVLHDLNNNTNHALDADNLPDNHEPTNHQANKTGDEGELSQNHDPEVMLSSLKPVPGQGEDGNTIDSKKKKKKAKKSSAKVLDSLNTNQDNNKMIGISSPALSITADVPNTQTDPTKQKEEEIELSSRSHYSEVMMSAKCRPSDQDEADVAATESGITMKPSDANVTKEHKISGSRKKKTAVKTARAVFQEASDMKHADKCVSKETSKRKLSDVSARSARNKADKLSGDEETLCPITQTAETEKGENMDGRMRINMEKSQNVGQSDIQDVPTKEQENETECGNQDEANKGIENARNDKKIVKKKTKKNQNTVEKDTGSLPINDKEVEEETTALAHCRKEVEAPSREQGNEKERRQLNEINKTCENIEDGERKSRKKTKKIKDQVPLEYVGGAAASSDRLGELDSSSKAPESLIHMALMLDPSDKTQEHAGNTTKKAKKGKGNQSSAAESHSNLPIKDQGVVEDVAAKMHELKELDYSSKTTRKTRKRQLNQFAVSEPECKKNAGENNFEETETEIPTGNLAEIARCEGEEVNFKQYFVPGQHHSEVVMKLSPETIAEKKVEEKGVPSVGTAPELQQGSIVSSADKAKNSTKSSKVIKTKNKVEKHGLHHAPTSLELEQVKTLQKPLATAINGSDTNKSVAAHTKENDKCSEGSSSTSSSESSERTLLKKKDVKESGLSRHVATGKRTSTKLRGEVKSTGKQEKSLLSTPRSIFQDESSDSSRDENGLAGSDASTRTPSEDSSSSGYSTDGSDVSQNSTKNGPNSVKGKGGSRKNIEFTGPKQIPMDVIFRSSSRFKKARLTASQQLNDSEIQPVEFVPDSQAPE